MTKRAMFGRSIAVATGALMLVGVAGAALADDHGSEDIAVNVQIEDDGQGVLALSVAADSTTLTEQGSNGTYRQFTGTLPTVTVTDTRSADEVPDGAFWYVLGSSSDFVGSAGQPQIGAGHLGWAPHLIDGGASGGVAEGEQVDTILDAGPDAVGLVDQELLAMAFDSAAIATEVQWTANADLFLRAPLDVAPGSYQASLTLSLFE